MDQFDLVDPLVSYVFGFLQADGHHYAGVGRKGSITIELKAADAALLYAIQRVLPWPTSITYRTRSTNFASHHDSATLTLCGLEGRMRLLELGLPTGRKSATVAPPAETFSHADYVRGLFDADGSVGFTAAGYPFLSLVTASLAIAEFTCAEMLRVTGARRTTNPNRRDGVYNVMLTSDPAAKFAAWLYGESRIALARKIEAARAVAAWERPQSMRSRSAPRRWTPADDAVVLGQPQRAAAQQLGRTVSSVSVRRWRLRQEDRQIG